MLASREQRSSLWQACFERARLFSRAAQALTTVGFSP